MPTTTTTPPPPPSGNAWLNPATNKWVSVPEGGHVNTTTGQVSGSQGSTSGGTSQTQTTKPPVPVGMIRDELSGQLYKSNAELMKARVEKAQNYYSMAREFNAKKEFGSYGEYLTGYMDVEIARQVAFGSKGGMSAQDSQRIQSNLLRGTDTQPSIISGVVAESKAISITPIQQPTESGATTRPMTEQEQRDYFIGKGMEYEAYLHNPNTPWYIHGLAEASYFIRKPVTAGVSGWETILTKDKSNYYYNLGVEKAETEQRYSQGAWGFVQYTQKSPFVIAGESFLGGQVLGAGYGKLALTGIGEGAIPTIARGSIGALNVGLPALGVASIGYGGYQLYTNKASATEWGDFALSIGMGTYAGYQGFKQGYSPYQAQIQAKLIQQKETDFQTSVTKSQGAHITKEIQKGDQTIGQASKGQGSMEVKTSLNEPKIEVTTKVKTETGGLYKTTKGETTSIGVIKGRGESFLGKEKYGDIYLKITAIGKGKTSMEATYTPTLDYGKGLKLPTPKETIKFTEPMFTSKGIMGGKVRLETTKGQVYTYKISPSKTQYWEASKLTGNEITTPRISIREYGAIGQVATKNQALGLYGERGIIIKGKPYVIKPSVKPTNGFKVEVVGGKPLPEELTTAQYEWLRPQGVEPTIPKSGTTTLRPQGVEPTIPKSGTTTITKPTTATITKTPTIDIIKPTIVTSQKSIIGSVLAEGVAKGQVRIQETKLIVGSMNKSLQINKTELSQERGQEVIQKPNVGLTSKTITNTIVMPITTTRIGTRTITIPKTTTPDIIPPTPIIITIPKEVALPPISPLAIGGTTPLSFKGEKRGVFKQPRPLRPIKKLVVPKPDILSINIAEARTGRAPRIAVTQRESERYERAQSRMPFAWTFKPRRLKT